MLQGIIVTALSRAIYFQVEICAVLLAEIVGPILAFPLMKHSVWLPIIVSPAIMAIGGLLFIAVSETWGTRMRKAHLLPQTSPSEPVNIVRPLTCQRYGHAFETGYMELHDFSELGMSSFLYQLHQSPFLSPLSQ